MEGAQNVQHTKDHPLLQTPSDHVETSAKSQLVINNKFFFKMELVKLAQSGPSQWLVVESVAQMSVEPVKNYLLLVTAKNAQTSPEVEELKRQCKSNNIPNVYQTNVKKSTKS